MIRYLINTARSLIFSTAPSPPAVAGALAALELLTERPHRVERLRSNARALRRALALEGFAVTEDDMHIVPLVVGDERGGDAALPGGDRAGRVRPGDPPTDRAARNLAAAPGGDGLAHRLRLRMAASVLGEAARRLGLDTATIGSPMIEHERSDEHDGRHERPYEYEQPAGIRATPG